MNKKYIIELLALDEKGENQVIFTDDVLVGERVLTGKRETKSGSIEELIVPLAQVKCVRSYEKTVNADA